VSDYVLLTGSTGLLGRYLIRDLLLAGRQVAVLARASRKETASQRIEAVMQMWDAELGQLLPRAICLEGDICAEGLGLDDRSLHWVEEHCSTLLHGAASLLFHADGSGEPFRSNVGGTENMLKLCRETGIRDLHYVSTAYVCGLREDVAREDELDVGQGFRNAYEQSKLEAELLVRQADFLDQLTVYRPTVISGDSETGYTNTYHGLHLYLRLMAILVPQQEVDDQGRRFTPIRLPMTGAERRNIVPVDWVSKVITHLLQSPEAHGRTFHLAPDKCLTPREIIDAGCSYFNSTGVEYVGDKPVDPATLTRFEAKFLPSIGMYGNYQATDPSFDCTNLHKFAGHLPCPEIDESTLHQYIRFGEEDRWGKRRQPKATAELSFDEPLNASC
jgi:thioester reductase-like protein